MECAHGQGGGRQIQKTSENHAVFIGNSPKTPHLAKISYAERQGRSISLKVFMRYVSFTVIVCPFFSRLFIFLFSFTHFLVLSYL